MSRRTTLGIRALLIAIAAMVLTGCGGSADPAGNGDRPPVVASNGLSIELTIPDSALPEGFNRSDISITTSLIEARTTNTGDTDGDNGE